MLKIRVTMLHILRLLLGRKGCHDGSCKYGRSVPVRGEKGLMSIGMETVRARRLHSRTVSPIQLRPTRSMSCRTSNGISPSSTPIIQIPPSNPPRPSPPESQSSHGLRMWKATMILLTKQFQPDTADLLLLRKADCAGFVQFPSRRND